MEQTEKKQLDGMVVQILVSAITVIIGALLLFVPQIKAEVFCCTFCVVLIIVAVISFIRFFVSEAYKRLHDYHFAIGIMLLILGICGLLGIEQFAKYFETYMGLISLILGTVILQSTVQLKLLNSPLWIVELVFSTAVLLGVIPVLAEITVALERVNDYTYWVFFISGILSLVSLLIAWIGIRGSQKMDRINEEDAVTESEEL